VLAADLIASALAGLFAIWFLLAYLRSHSTDIFSFYRIAAAVVFAILITQG